MAAAFAAILVYSPPGPEAGSFSPAQVKAAMLIKFTDFITWPEQSFESTPDTFVIGVMKSPEIYEQLSMLSGSSVKGKTLRVIRVSDGDFSDPVHLLYVDASQVDQLKKKWVNDAYPPVLTVSDSEEFLDAGGIMAFLPKDSGRIGFAVNRTVQLKSGLNFSSALLKLAEIKVSEGVAQE